MGSSLSMKLVAATSVASFRVRGGLCGISIPRDERAFGQTAHVRARVRPRSAPLQRALSRLRARRPRRRGFPLSERGLEVGRLRGELLFPSPLTTRAGRARPQKLPLEPRLGTAHRQRVVVRASYKKTAERHRAVVSRVAFRLCGRSAPLSEPRRTTAHSAASPAKFELKLRPARRARLARSGQRAWFRALAAQPPGHQTAFGQGEPAATETPGAEPRQRALKWRGTRPAGARTWGRTRAAPSVRSPNAGC